MVSSGPKAPNPYAQASADQQAQTGAAIGSSIINNPNEQSPYGSVNYQIAGWEQVPDAQGKMQSIPRYTRTTTLSPDEQKIAGWDSGTRYNLGRTATQQSAKIGDYLNQSINTQGWAPWQQAAAPGEVRQDQGATDRGAIEKAMLGRWEDSQGKSARAQDAQLAARGMSPGSQGYSDVQQGRDQAGARRLQSGDLAEVPARRRLGLASQQSAQCPDAGGLRAPQSTDQ
jgi:hypothetical protein